MKITRTFSFSQQEARERMMALTGYWAKYGVKSQWDGDEAHMSGAVKGIQFKASVYVEASRVVADVRVGFLAEKLGGRKYVEGKIDEYLDPNTSLEELRQR